MVLLVLCCSSCGWIQAGTTIEVPQWQPGGRLRQFSVVKPHTKYLTAFTIAFSTFAISSLHRVATWNFSHTCHRNVTKCILPLFRALISRTVAVIPLHAWTRAYKWLIELLAFRREMVSWFTLFWRGRFFYSTFEWIPLRVLSLGSNGCFSFGIVSFCAPSFDIVAILALDRKQNVEVT